MLFRASPAITGHDQFSGYLFQINDVGQYRISRVSASFGSIGDPTIIPLQNWTNSPALLKGNSALNNLEVIANGLTLDFYINWTFIGPEVDSNYTSGEIAFYATSDGKTEADVVYSDLNIYPIS